MWHIFGPVVRWPLHSPLRLFGVVVAVIVAIMLLGAINDRGSARDAAPSSPVATSTPGPRDGSSPTPAPRATPAGTADGSGSDGSAAAGTDAFSSDPTAREPMLAAQQAAAEFVAVWARPDLDATSWQAGLAAHTTPQLLASLADTDPANVPAVTVSGQPVEVATNAEAGVFDVPTTGEFVRVHVQLIDGTWLATDVEPTA
jgi:hypothetical protein